MGKMRVSVNDIFQYRQPRQLALAPDGSRVAFVLETPSRLHDERMASLYWVDARSGGAAHRLTRGASREQSPQWSPDGRYLAFLSTRPDELELAPDDPKPPSEDPEPRAQIWVLDLLAGGEPRQLTRRPEGVAQFCWSPDGTEIAFSARDPSPAQEAYLRAIRDKKRPGPLVIDRVQHKHDGDGYLDNVSTHLFVIHVPSRAERRLTDGSASETDPRWAPDGQWIVFSSNRTGDPDNNARNDLWLINPQTAVTRRLTQGDVDASGAVFSPDGHEVAFISSLEPENSYRLRHVMAVRVADSTAVEDLAHDIGQGWTRVGGVVPDGPAADPVAQARVYPIAASATPFRVLTEGIVGPVAAVRWPEADTLWALVADRGQWRLASLSVTGRLQYHVPDGPMGSVNGFDAVPGMTIALVDQPDTAGELYRVTPGHALQRLTHLHDEWLSQRALGSVQRIAYRNHDGVTIDAVVVSPPAFDPAAGPAPLLVNIHGGPMSFDPPAFDFDAQYWAARGYLVLMPNYRGSISYGEPFCQVIQGRWGPMEHDDVMCGVDELVSRGWADPERLYCTGFSQGGIMTNWAVGHTDRFRAAVSEHGMWDYVAAYGTDDCHLWWQDDLGVPWQNEETYRRISPLSGVEHIRTPLLITAGELDWRCPLNQAEQLYLALKKRGVPTELVIYPGEHHAITRLSRAVDRHRRIMAWLARYGGPAPEDPPAP